MAASTASVFADTTQTTFLLQGYINFQENNLSNDYGLASGESFTGFLTYNPSTPGNPIHGAAGGPVAYALNTGSPFLALFVNGREFDLFSPFLYVYHDTGSSLVTTDAGTGADPSLHVNTPWGSYNGGPGTPLSPAGFTLQNQTGAGLTDNSLPVQYNIADWTTSRINLGEPGYTSGGVTYDGWYLNAQITSITLAPEPGAFWLATLAAGVFGLACCFRNRRAPGRTLNAPRLTRH